MTEDVPRWWQSGLIYQIYPRSFQDSDGNGIGDLVGIRQRLDYLQDLGVDAIWLSPMFVSPMKDFGYDVADYCAIDPRFGTMEDFEALLADARGRGIRIILDLVPNHTSDQHAWFQEARSSRDNPKRDWYLWSDPAPNGGRPNNWLSEFGGPAWAFDATTDQYYYHAFLPEQPDLNWRNPDVRAAIYDVMRFWLGKGVGGFRVDVLWHLLKDDARRDNPANPGWREGMSPTQRLLPIYTTDLPDMQSIVREMRAVVDEFDERVLIGELYLPIERLVRYYGEELDGAHLPFNFALIEAPWHARELDRLIRDYEAAVPDGGWPNWVLGNHDKPRIAGRVGVRQARVAAMLLLTLRGTPTLYYGDEIGMPQATLSGAESRDPVERNVPGFGLGRDGCRTPMQWDTSPNAGFTTGTPWLPIATDDPAVTVAGQAGDLGSMLALHKRLIDHRRRHPALSVGGFHPLAADGDVLLYQREHGGERFLVALNLGPTEADVGLETSVRARVAIATEPQREGETIAGTFTLGPDEGLVLDLLD